MRPKKIVLCVNTNPNALSELTFLLYVRGFNALPANDWIDAKLIFGEVEVDLVIVDGAVDFALCGILKSQKPAVPIVILGTRSQAGMMHRADSMLIQPTAEELIERVKVMTARKRGPRPGYGKKPPVSETVAEEVRRVMG